MAEEANGNEAAAKDLLLKKLEATIHGLLAAKRRYPLIARTASELDKLVAAVGQTTGKENVRLRNDAVLQLLRDAFDMLVIDLASLREGFTEKHGVLNELAAHPERIKLCGTHEFAPKPATVINVADEGSETVDIVEGYANQLVADNVNEAIRKLFGEAFPVTTAAVKALITRFRKDTEDIDRDRNHVRAHRYEHRQGDRFEYFQPLSALPKHIEVFDSYVGALYLVLTRNSYHLELPFSAGGDQTATDLADLIVHGSINSATIAYGVPRKTEDNRVPWYYALRLRFFAGAKPTVRDDEN